MTDADLLARRFETDRARLRAIAYRMLGSRTDAEDAVQEAWLRLSRAGDADVENLGGWLTTVVARVCLDMLRVRRARREESADEAVPRLAAAADAEQEALLAESVGLAMLVVLDRLTPAERVAFVLHDMFDLPFEEIAGIVGRSVDASRQLASRARRRVRGATGDPDGRSRPPAPGGRGIPCCLAPGRLRCPARVARSIGRGPCRRRGSGGRGRA